MDRRAARRYHDLLGKLGQADGDALDLRKRVAELSTLLDLTMSLGSDLSGQEMLDAVLLTVMGALGTAQGAVFVRGPSGTDECRAFRGLAASALHRAPLTTLPDDDIVDRSSTPYVEALAACGLEMLCPVVQSGRRVAALGVGAKLDGRKYTESERGFLRAVAACVATPIENALMKDELREVNRRLSLRIFQLASLFDVTRELTSSFDEEAIKGLTVATLMGHLVVSRCALYLDGPRGLALAHERGVDAARAEALLPADEAKALSLALRSPLATSELPAGRLRARLLEKDLTTVVPLCAAGGCAGLVALGQRLSGEAFGEEDWELVATLGRQALAALETVRLQRVQSEKQRQDRELQIAREIQQSLFPKAFPGAAGYEIAGATRPCYEVGGDYYDVMTLDGSRCAFVIADVSGKGVPASILMASLHASLHALAGTADPAVIMSRLNQFLYASTQPSKFATVFYGELDPASGRLSYVNGGHIPPFLLAADGGVRRLEAGGPAVGVIRNAVYEVGRVDLAPGDLLAMVTDGLTEARSAHDEELGEQRLEAALRRAGGEPAPTIESLMAAVRDWSGTAGCADDLTALVVRVSETGGRR